MPTSAATASAAAAAFTASFIPKQPSISSLPLIKPSRIRPHSFRISCQVAVTTDVPSSSSVTDEESEAASKVGKKIRVKVPLKVYHVNKAPDLDLNGLEGVIKQYVGVWKGKSISANLPFKVEFFVPVEGQPAPVKVLAHLKEDEFDYLEEA